MTTQEAIDVLQNSIVRFGRNCGKTVYAEALDMAIEALSCSEEPNRSEPKCAEGCIYGWGSNECDDCDYYKWSEPKTSDSGYKSTDIARNTQNETENGDLIRRQAVQEMVDRIGGMYPYRQIGNRESYSKYNEAWTDAINRVDAELNSLPSAQPKKGKWIETEFLKLKECSCCHSRWGMYDVENFDFCPNCGADMRGET